MQAHGEKLFIGVESVEGFFLYDRAPVHEIEHPYRHCAKALYLHLWPGKAIVIGRWRDKNKGLEEHLMDALRGRHIDFQEEKARFSNKHEAVQQGETTGEHD